MGKQKLKGVLGLGGSSGVQHGSSVCEVLCTPVSLRLWPGKQDGPLDNLVIITYSKAEKSKLFDIHMQ